MNNSQLTINEALRPFRLVTSLLLRFFSQSFIRQEVVTEYLSELTEQFSKIFDGLDQLNGIRRGNGISNITCGLTPTPIYGEDNWYHCRRGWEGQGGWVQLGENHYLDLLGVLRSHKEASPGMYNCKICGEEYDFKSFENCVFSHRWFFDGVKLAKDAYGLDRVYKGSWEYAYRMSEMEKEAFQNALRR